MKTLIERMKHAAAHCAMWDMPKEEEALLDGILALANANRAHSLC